VGVFIEHRVFLACTTSPLPLLLSVASCTHFLFKRVSYVLSLN